MRMHPRSFIGLLLAALLVLTGQSMAVARGLPGPAGQMVICTSSGPVMISVDADGAPTGPAHICPDAALSLIQIAMDSPPPERSVDAAPVNHPGLAAQSVKQRDVWQLQARGPPSTA